MSGSSNNRLLRMPCEKVCVRHPRAKKKIIEVPDNSGKFHINEEVQLCGQSSLGLQAVLLAFVFPLIIVFAAIVTGTSMQWEETTSGLTGLLLLVPYYCILYFLRDKTEKAIHIYFEKNLIDKHIMIFNCRYFIRSNRGGRSGFPLRCFQEI